MIRAFSIGKRTAKLEVAILLSFTFLALAGPVQGAQQHTAAGLVLKVDTVHRTLLVSCQSIPGYMDAMVMPFSVASADSLQGLSPGDEIGFTIVGGEGKLYAEQIQIRHFQSSERDSLAARRLSLVDKLLDPPGSPPELQCGQRVPDFTLIDQSRQSVSLSQFAGKVIALTFIYTRCPLPNYCFRLSNNFGLLQKRFQVQMGRDLMLMSISFDPVHDQPDVLQRYGAIWKADAKGWRLLTGDADAVRAIGREFGMEFWPDEGLMTHSLHTVILDRQGKLAANVEGNEFTADQLGDLVQSVIGR